MRDKFYKQLIAANIKSITQAKTNCSMHRARLKTETDEFMIMMHNEGIDRNLHIIDFWKMQNDKIVKNLEELVETSP